MLQLRATHRGCVRRNLQLLLDLPASNNMPHSGDFVRAGHFDESLTEEDDHAKECLFVVRKR
jgi:hypothetical protein